MTITVQQVKSLRDKTGAGVMDAKRALEEVAGDETKAEQILIAQGIALATNRTGRAANEGVIAAYVHDGGKVGATVKLQCETDFVANTDEFKQLAYDIAMQITAMSPKYTDRKAADAAGDGATPSADELLLEQKFIKDAALSVGDKIKELMSKVGENIRVTGFERFSIHDIDD